MESPRRGANYFESVDINFDGYQDVALLSWWSATGNEGWQFWRFDPATQKFIEDPIVSTLPYPEFDPKTQTIRSFWRMGFCEDMTTTYRYLSGTLVATQQEQCERSVDHPDALPCHCHTVYWPPKDHPTQKP